MPPKATVRNPEVHATPAPPVPMANTKLTDEINKFDQDVEQFINHPTLDANAIQAVSSIIQQQLSRLNVLQKFGDLDFGLLDDSAKQALAEKLGLAMPSGRKRRSHGSAMPKLKPDEKIIKHIRDNPGCTADEVSDKLKAGRAGVDYWKGKISELVAANRVKVVGDKLSVA